MVVMNNLFVFKLHTLCQCALVIFQAVLIEYLLRHAIPLVRSIALVANIR